MRKSGSLFLLSTMFLLAAINCHAALYDRGNGMIYDSTQDITWLQDATLYGNTYAASKAWTVNLNVGGITGWRLPSASLIGNTSFSYDGSTDVGFNNTRSEIGHLFAELGNLAYYNTSGVQILGANQNAGFKNGWFVDAGSGQLRSFHLSFSNLWQSEEAEPNASAYVFYTQTGYQDKTDELFIFSAWAVHSGDVAGSYIPSTPPAPVPVPAAAWLFGSGLMGLISVARKSKVA